MDSSGYIFLGDVYSGYSIPVITSSSLDDQ